MVDDLTIVRWTINFDYNEYKDTTYYSIPEDSSIMKFIPDSNNSPLGKFELVAGVPFNYNYVDSKLISSLFNRPQSILFYYYSSKRNYQELNKIIGIVDSSIPGCTNTLSANNLGSCGCTNQIVNGKISCEDKLYETCKLSEI